MRAFIIDDEPQYVTMTKDILREVDSKILVLGEAFTIDEAVQKLQNISVDIVFFDVELEHGTSFDILEKLDDVDFEIVFVTAHQHYAIQAFRQSALHYILKPAGVEDYKEVIDRVKEKHNSANKRSQVQNLLHNISSATANKKLTIATSDGYEFVESQEIIRIKSDGSYSTLFLKTGREIVASSNLGFFEKLLDEKKFFRVHRANLVNIESVRKFKRLDGNWAVMEDGAEVEIARRRKDEFLELLKA